MQPSTSQEGKLAGGEGRLSDLVVKERVHIPPRDSRDGGHTQILQLLTVTGIAVSLLASLRKMGFQSHENYTQKIVKIAVNISPFFFFVCSGFWFEQT